jgi:hypothetical protein
MKKSNLLILVFLMLCGTVFGQNNNFEKLNFLLGKWTGTGAGFGNETSKIESEFKSILKGKYIEVVNDSKFKPTEKNPEGEHHIDKGFISFDKIRKLIVFRQFNIEGYVNQYTLNDSLSTDTVLVFETETIENFMPGGKAKWTIKKISEEKIETVFEVLFPGKKYTCYGRNTLTKQK